jgi:hypothetical protein
VDDVFRQSKKKENECEDSTQREREREGYSIVYLGYMNLQRRKRTTEMREA